MKAASKDNGVKTVHVPDDGKVALHKITNSCRKKFIMNTLRGGGEGEAVGGENVWGGT